MTATSNHLRDGDIRQSLEDWLVDQHSSEGDTNIIHEMKVTRPSARIDLAVVNGILAGFEIKSDVDSLDRLAVQANAFNAVFDTITLVTTKRHLGLARQKLPRWWGLLAAEGATIKVKRTAKRNPKRRVESLLYALSKTEILHILRTRELIDGHRSYTLAALVEFATNQLSADEIRSGVRSVLKLRRGRWVQSSSPAPART